METINQRSLSDLLQDMDGFTGAACQGATGGRGRNARLVAEAEWRAAIAALTILLPTLPRSTTATRADTGLAISGPLPVLNEADLGQRLESWVATPQPLASVLRGQHILLPAGQTVASPPSGMQVLPLTLNAPLLTEKFCLLLTPALSLALVLGQPTGASPQLQYSFDPQAIAALWQQIQLHIATTVEDSVEHLDQRISEIVSVPDYRIITRFTQTLMAHLPHRTHPPTLTADDRGSLRFAHWSNAAIGNGHHAGYQTAELLTTDTAQHNSHPQSGGGEETELLQAMAHEIRTPLTTIRTLTRSLLRRKDVSVEVKNRLTRIDTECTQQIDRFNLIFRAVELETTERDRPRSALTPIALSQIFSDAIPRWQQQAQRRNLKLDVTLPPDLPKVTSDPTLLNEVLTGVVEWFTQCLPPQSHIHMAVMLAGHQLKLQFEAQSLAEDCSPSEDSTHKRQSLKALGQLLTVVPETGGVSLNLDVTKNLFEFLGGKLILRQRPEQGDVLTAFLPLDTREV